MATSSLMCKQSWQPSSRIGTERSTRVSSSWKRTGRISATWATQRDGRMIPGPFHGMARLDSLTLPESFVERSQELAEDLIHDIGHSFARES